MSLAVKYRPQTFEEVVEQSITTEILKKQIANRAFKNCYGFFGASGCGKTTCARIFARTINGADYDPIEVDGGTISGSDGDTTGADRVRKLVELAKKRDLTGEYKIIIIDECQNLGGGRKDSPTWAALLKCLEECPKYTIFIMCSTNPEKIPEAILNRLQRYNFAPISQKGIRGRLDYICKQEGFTNYEKTCDFISKLCLGSAREAIASLELVSDYSKDLSLEVAKKVLGGLSYETMFKLTWALQQKKQDQVMSIVDELYNGGQNLKTFLDAYLTFVVDLAKYTIFKDIDLTDIPAYLADEANPVVQATTANYSTDYFNDLADTIFDVKAAIKNDVNYKATIEILLVRFCRRA